MMSSRPRRFKRSLFTALTALALAISPVLVARDASAAEEARSEEAAAKKAESPGSDVGKKAAPKKKARAKKKDAAETPRAGSSKKKQKKATAEKEAKKAERSTVPALSRSVGHSADPEKGEKTAAAESPDAKASPESAPATKGEKAPAAKKSKVKERDKKTAERAAGDEKAVASKDDKALDKGDASQKSQKSQASQTSEKTKTAKASAKKNKRTASRSNSSKRRAEKPSAGDKEAPPQARKAPPKPCFGPAVAIDRSGLEGERLPLVMCDGKPIDEARERLSVLARPWGAARPELPAAPAPKTAPHTPHTAAKGAKPKPARPVDSVEVAPGIRRVDAGLLKRIDAIARRFPDRPISVVSGYRPQSRGSLHQTARAIDLRVAGVPHDELVAFCKTLPDTGCGYYPNSSFVHVDVRLPGTGGVSWIDASGPGEAPRYVTQWPPPPDPSPAPAFVPPESAPASDDAKGNETDPAEASQILEPRAGAEKQAGEPAFEDPN
ncbi:MAG TPA: DUF882 domain-containing protein [Polyangiaceae bacterium]|nr:DUF882 domain-containing protein [Polyangiaceae bacterium]